MSDADLAYAAAERMIAELGVGTRLNFDRDETRALTRLPEEIAGLTGLPTLILDNTGVTDAGLEALGRLTGLQTLWLNNTGVTDAGLAALRGLTGLRSLSLNNTGVTDAGLAALLGLTGLRTLSLDNTGVRDLRALKDMSSLVEGAKVWGGLSFAGTAATRLDPELKRLSEIGDDEERTRATLDYLRGLGEDWPPVPSLPGDRGEAPAFVLPDIGPLRSEPMPPEGGDEDQLALQEDLRRKVAEVIAAVGGTNEPGPVRVKQSAEHYQRHVNRSLGDIRLKLLWSAANALRNAWEADQRAVEMGRQTEQLPPLVAGLLRDLVETHGLFIMGFPNGAALEREMRSYLTGARNPDLLAAGQKVVEAFQKHQGVIDPDDMAALGDDAETAKGTGPSAEMAERSLTGRLWNALGAVGRKLWVGVKWVAVGGAGLAVTTVLANDIVAVLYGNETLIMTYLKLAQGEAAIWFPRLLEAIRALRVP